MVVDAGSQPGKVPKVRQPTNAELAARIEAAAASLARLEECERRTSEIVRKLEPLAVVVPEIVETAKAYQATATLGRGIQWLSKVVMAALVLLAILLGTYKLDKWTHGS